MPGFSTVNCNTRPPAPFHPPFEHCTLWREVTVHSPHRRSGELGSSALTVENLHKLFGILLHGRCISPSTPPFVYSVVYLCQYGLVDFYFILWVIIQHYFVQIVPALAIRSFSVGYCVPLAYPHVLFFLEALPYLLTLQVPFWLLMFACDAFCPVWSSDRSHAQWPGSPGLASTQLITSPHLCDSLVSRINLPQVSSYSKNQMNVREFYYVTYQSMPSIFLSLKHIFDFVSGSSRGSSMCLLNELVLVQ